MKKIKKVTEEREIHEYYCDFCDKKTSPRTCIICGRHACSKHYHDTDLYMNLDYPSFCGDYPDKVCHECWDKGKEIRTKIMNIRKKAEDEEEKLFEEWKRECKYERP